MSDFAISIRLSVTDLLEFPERHVLCFDPGIDEAGNSIHVIKLEQRFVRQTCCPGYFARASLSLAASDTGLMLNASQVKNGSTGDPISPSDPYLTAFCDSFVQTMSSMHLLQGLIVTVDKLWIHLIDSSEMSFVILGRQTARAISEHNAMRPASGLVVAIDPSTKAEAAWSWPLEKYDRWRFENQFPKHTVMQLCFDAIS